MRVKKKQGKMMQCKIILEKIASETSKNYICKTKAAETLT